MKKINRFPSRSTCSFLRPFYFGLTPEFVTRVIFNKINADFRLIKVLPSSVEVSLDLPFYRYQIIFSLRNLNNRYDYFVANTYSRYNYSDFIRSFDKYDCCYSFNLFASLYHCSKFADSSEYYVYKIGSKRFEILNKQKYFDY